MAALVNDGITAVYGDASLRATLEQAGLARSIALILSVEHLPNSGEVIRVAREINPDVRIYARANYLKGAETLRAAGADFLVSDEAEVALTFTELLLRQLGATDEQIDRERARCARNCSGIESHS